jgi:acyl-CoA thioester hydrolase
VFSYSLQVQIFDTDCYGVMWHGAYTKWLELARCDAMRSLGVELPYPGEGYVYPVVAQQFAYKKPARLNEALQIETRIEVKGPRLIFHQQIVREQGGELLVDTQTTCVVTDAHFKPYRRVPEDLQQKLAQTSQA